MRLAALLVSLALTAAPASLALAQAPAPAPADDAFPTGAPTDDYGLMGWCYGALQGHLDLYQSVMPEVQRIETAFPQPGETPEKITAQYKLQHTRGEQMLTRYGQALTALEAKKQTGGVARKDAIEKGREVWGGSEKADARQLAQLWMSWGLPGRCDSTARRVTPVKGK
jgi:hypothetical protein